MRYKESLLWILDGKIGKLSFEEKTQKNIDFVHSLHEKCDYVGWSKLDLSKDNAAEILDKIESFCKENNMKARGIYEREFIDFTTDWYEIEGEDFKENEESDAEEIKQFLNTIMLDKIKAYNIMGGYPKYSYGRLCVSDKFRKICSDNGADNLKYCWMEDVGKYQAEQYFAVSPRTKIPRVLIGADASYMFFKPNKVLSFLKMKRIKQLGGFLPRLSEIFSDLTIVVPRVLLKKDLPKTSVASAHVNPFFSVGIDFVVHKDLANKLLEGHAISEKNLKPICVVDDILPGYVIKRTIRQSFPKDEICATRMLSYEKLMSKERPKRFIQEKDAIKLLKYEVKNRTSDFKKGLSKKELINLTGTDYELLIPYYSVCDGGQLNYEYRLVGYKESIEATISFFNEFKKQERIDNPIEGIVIAECSCGDTVVLTKDKEVIRISHEDPTFQTNFKELHSFIYEILEDQLS